MGKIIPIKAWSFSRYGTYKQCPRKLKLNAIDKIKEPSNEAMERGARIHDEAEAFIKGKLASLPVELKKFAKLFRRLKKQYRKKLSSMVVEDTWAFTDSWDETMWNDWANCWVRIKLDCAEQINDTTLVVFDWKTGKFREEKNEEYIEQLELYALAALILHPHIETVYAHLVYTDQGTMYPTSIQDAHESDLFFTRKDIDRLKSVWEKRVKPMLKDTVFAPRPSNLCNWCFYRKGNYKAGGGQCEY